MADKRKPTKRVRKRKNRTRIDPTLPKIWIADAKGELSTLPDWRKAGLQEDDDEDAPFLPIEEMTEIIGFNPKDLDKEGTQVIRPRRTTGKKLNLRWNMEVRQARYNDKGKFYRVLDRFPAALCDRNGFVRFATRREYERCTSLAIGRRINVKDGIATMAGYTAFEKSLRVADKRRKRH